MPATSPADLPPRPPGPREQVRLQRRRWLWRGVAVLLTIAFAVAAWEGYDYLLLTRAPQDVLVVGTVRAEDGSGVAGFAFVMDSGGAVVSVVDVLADRSIPGSSARTLREAFPLGGAGLVSATVRRELGGSSRQWIALEPEAWAQLVDAAGGMRADSGNRVDVYLGERLVTLRPGTVRYDGSRSVALATGLEYIDSPKSRLEVQESLAGAVAAGLSSEPDLITRALESGQLSSSLRRRQLAALTESLASAKKAR